MGRSLVFKTVSTYLYDVLPSNINCNVRPGICFLALTAFILGSTCCKLYSSALRLEWIRDLMCTGGYRDVYNMGTKDMYLRLPEGTCKKQPDLQIELKRQPVSLGHSLVLVQLAVKHQWRPHCKDLFIALLRSATALDICRLAHDRLSAYCASQ